MLPIASPLSSEPAEKIDATVQIDVHKTTPVSPELYGIFFEDINYAGEGGIYAELVRNRFFEEAVLPPRCDFRDNCVVNPNGWRTNFPIPESIPGWATVAPAGTKVTLALETSDTLNSMRERSLRVTIASAADGPAGVTALGWGGIPVKSGARYRATVWAKAEHGFSGPLTLALRSGVTTYDSVETGPLSGAWKKFEVELTSNTSDPKAKLYITAKTAGTFQLSMVSLFPAATWMNRPNGLRPDLMEMLAALKPKFLRFPGGCVVEGFSNETAIRWKTTIGPIERRRGHYSLWGYRNTNGLGFHEFLQMTEDLGAVPMFVANCGMTCQGRNPELIPVVKLDDYIQDALDAIEYANGPVTSRWGAERARNGHAAPFGLKYLEIGNENWGPDYAPRYKKFYEAIHARHPEIVLIATSNVEGAPMQMLDDHFYPDPDYFISHRNHYDNASRTGPKIYVGELAAILDCGKGNLRAAVGEAAFLIGLERNPDIVRMASYAPLFKHVAHPNPWNPDAIVFDNHRAFGTPSFHLFQLFGSHRGDELLATTINSPVRPLDLRGGVAVGPAGADVEFRDIRVEKGGQPLLVSDFSNGVGVWEYRGPWKTVDGALSAVHHPDSLASEGAADWTNYTLSLRARKTAGPGGLRLHVLDNHKLQGDRRYVDLVLGENNEFKLERVLGWTTETLVPIRPGSLETGRWYDIRIEITSAQILVFLDGELIITTKLRDLADIVAVATRESATGTVIVKVINTATVPRNVRFELPGAPQFARTGKIIVLTGASPETENDFDTPDRVAPVENPLEDVSGNFTHMFPPHSISVLRLKP
jgi:alpha-L-arabinofuranosidase